jgi:hypothetical protein
VGNKVCSWLGLGESLVLTAVEAIDGRYQLAKALDLSADCSLVVHDSRDDPASLAMKLKLWRTIYAKENNHISTRNERTH